MNQTPTINLLIVKGFNELNPYGLHARGGLNREFDAYGCAMTRYGIYTQFGVVVINYFSADKQSISMTGRFGREFLTKSLFKEAFLNADAVICDSKAEIVIGRIMCESDGNLS